MELFNYLKENNQLNSHAKFFDWIFDEKLHFNNWESSAVSSFTKHIKKEFNYFDIISSKKILVDMLDNEYVKSYLQVAVINNGNSAGRDLIRHIRNSIAHSRIDIIRKKKEHWIKLIDYNKQSKNNTAYIIIKISTLLKIFNIYQEIQIAVDNGFFKSKK